MINGFGWSRRRGLLGVLAGLAVVGLGAAPAAAAPFVYVSTDPPGNSGIPDKVFQFDAPRASSEALQPLTPAYVDLPDVPGAQQMAVSPEGNSFYGANGGAPAQVYQYNIDPITGRLSPKSPATVATFGASANAVVLTPDGKSAYVTNGNIGPRANTISQFNISPSTGKLHPKSPATVSTGGKGGGAEAVSPNGKSLYVDSGRSILQFNISRRTGKLHRKSPARVFAGNGLGAEAVSPNGKSLYVLSGAHGGSVLQFNINPRTGELHPKSPPKVATGEGPSAVALTPNGKSLYVNGGSAIEQYNINPRTGKLSPKSPATVSPGGNSIVVTPDGKSAYVNAGRIYQFNINQTTGTLSPKSAPSMYASRYPLAMAITPDADASVKVRAPASITTGSDLTYRITVKNAGPSRAWQVKLKDVLPSGTKFVKLSATRARCRSPKAGTKGATVTCELGRLRPGKGAKVRIVVQVTAKATKGTITDLAKVTSVTPDPLSTNNTTTAQTKLRR